MIFKNEENGRRYLGQEVTDAVITVPAYLAMHNVKQPKKPVSCRSNVRRIVERANSCLFAYGLDKVHQI